MDISPKQLVSKKKVGICKKGEVMYAKTKGGLHMVFVAPGEGKKPEFLGFGPHKAVARHLAEENEPDLEWTELSKSDHYNLEDFQHLLPEYRELTNQARTMGNGE
jgi:hypothetical protein